MLPSFPPRGPVPPVSRQGKCRPGLPAWLCGSVISAGELPRLGQHTRGVEVFAGPLAGGLFPRKFLPLSENMREAWELRRDLRAPRHHSNLLRQAFPLTDDLVLPSRPSKTGPRFCSHNA